MIVGKDATCLDFVVPRGRMAAWLNMFAIQAQHFLISAQHRNAFFFVRSRHRDASYLPQRVLMARIMALLIRASNRMVK